jgi:hypothetical protein
MSDMGLLPGHSRLKTLGGGLGPMHVTVRARGLKPNFSVYQLTVTFGGQ